MNTKLIKTGFIVAGVWAALATSAFAAGPYTLGGSDDSMSRFGGDGYQYFHEGRPGLAAPVTPFRVTNPKGLDEAAYAAYSSEDPEWQPKVAIDKSRPAADPIARPKSVAEEKAFFKSEDRYLEGQSTR